MDIGDVSWEQILRRLGILYKKRSTGVLVLLCAFNHEEKTPSLHCWPSGKFRCHGCCRAGDMIFFVRLHQFGILDDSSQTELENFFANLPALPGPGQADLPFQS